MLPPANLGIAATLTAAGVPSATSTQVADEISKTGAGSFDEITEIIIDRTSLDVQEIIATAEEIVAIIVVARMGQEGDADE